MDKIYSDLNDARREIRLLVIQPSSASDTIIECSLEVISLDDHPEYIALSYVWGHSAIVEEISINGVSLAVTTNLATVLRQLRANRSGEKSSPIKGLPSLLWADAICINQQNDSERSSQVQLMRDIYQTAVKVISWLGPEADRSTEAFLTLRAVAQEIAHLPQVGNRFEWLRRYPDLIADKGKGQPNQWDDIHQLLMRDYWKRTWVFQEVVLAKEVLVMCGEESLPLEDALRVENWLKSIKITDERPSFIEFNQWRLFVTRALSFPHPIKRIDIFRALWRHSREAEPQNIGGETGLRILDFTRSFLATDPRDHIYGVLGVTAITVDIVPDYSKSVRDVFTEAALEYLKLYGLTLTLNLVKPTPGNRFGLPSWVPNWSSYRRPLRIREYFPEYKGPNPDPTAFHVDSSNPNVLCVKGVRLCGIRELGPEHLSVSDLKHDPQLLSVRAWQLYQEILDRYRNQLYPTGIPPLRAILRLIVDENYNIIRNGRLEVPSEIFFNLGATFIGTALRHDKTHMEISERIEKHLPKLGLVADENFARTFSEQFLGPGFDPPRWTSARQALGNLNAFDYFKFCESLAETLVDSRYFYTDDGYFGRGSFEIRPHDFVCALKGCEFPVILRQDDPGFTFLGTCVVQGLVEEGVLKDVIDGATSLEEFKLH